MKWWEDENYEPPDEFLLATQRAITARAVNPRVRAIVIFWLFKVADWVSNSLCIDTLLLTIKLIDQVTFETKETMKLIAMACLMIACKVEEIYPVEVDDYVYLSDSAFDRHELLEMESRVLDALKYRIRTPLLTYFVQPKGDVKLIEYLIYIATIDSALSGLLPSVVGETIMDIVNDGKRHPHCIQMFKTAVKNLKDEHRDKKRHTQLERIFTRGVLGVWFGRLRIRSGE